MIDNQNNKPEIFNTYNATKAGVDTLDQLVRFYTVRRKTKRWPLVIFYNILDIACYNSLVIYCEKFPEYKTKYNNRVRRHFISDLVVEILNEYGQKSEKVVPVAKMSKQHYKEATLVHECSSHHLVN